MVSFCARGLYKINVLVKGILTSMLNPEIDLDTNSKFPQGYNPNGIKQQQIHSLNKRLCQEEVIVLFLDQVCEFRLARRTGIRM